MASFSDATGIVIEGMHVGKSRALNLALEHCTADFVWLLPWVPFEMLKRFFLLDALLAYRMRPVKPPLALRTWYPTWRSMLTPWRSPTTESAHA